MCQRAAACKMEDGNSGNLRLITIRNGEGPEVTPRRPNRTGRLLVKARSKLDRT